MPHQRETDCDDRVGQGRPRGAGRPSGPGVRLSSGDRPTCPNPQGPCRAGGSGGQNCGKTRAKLGKSRRAWGNLPLISRSNPFSGHCVAKAAGPLDMADQAEGLAWGGRHGSRMGPISPCVQLVTETVWDWPQAGACPSPSWGAGCSAAGLPRLAPAWLRRRWAWLLAARVRGPRGWSAWG